MREKDGCRAAKKGGGRKRNSEETTHTTPGRPCRYIHVHDAAWRHRIVRRASIVVTIVSLRHYSKTIVRHNETDGRMSGVADSLSFFLCLQPRSNPYRLSFSFPYPSCCVKVLSTRPALRILLAGPREVGDLLPRNPSADSCIFDLRRELNDLCCGGQPRFCIRAATKDFSLETKHNRFFHDEESLEQGTGFQYVLFLIHWPRASNGENEKGKSRKKGMVETSMENDALNSCYSGGTMITALTTAAKIQCGRTRASLAEWSSNRVSAIKQSRPVRSRHSRIAFPSAVTPRAARFTGSLPRSLRLVVEVQGMKGEQEKYRQ